MNFLCEVFACDLGDLSNLENNTAGLFKNAAKTDCSEETVYEQIVFINNAGSLGPLTPIGTQNGSDALSNLSKCMDFNVTSSCYLTTELIRLYKSSYLNSKKLVIVNMSSLAAVQPFESWAAYCAGKAARDMFHQVLASETEKDTNISVLNYAPGPLDTDMGAEIRDSETLSPEIRAYFRSLKDENKYVPVKDSAKKLVKLVMLGLFKSGSHVDYFDHVSGIDSLPEGPDRISTGNPKTDTITHGLSPISSSECDKRSKCQSECKYMENSKSAPVGGCTSCGCNSKCGPECKCASSNTTQLASASASSASSVPVGGCTSCGCNSKCGPEYKCR